MQPKSTKPLQPFQPSAARARKQGDGCAVMADAESWSGALPGSSTSGDSGWVTNIMRKTFQASSTAPQASSACGIDEMAQGGSGNGHHGGKAEISMNVGEAMGKAMVNLLKNK